MKNETTMVSTKKDVPTARISYHLISPITGKRSKNGIVVEMPCTSDKEGGTK